MLTLSIMRSTTCRGIMPTPLSCYRNSVPALVHAEARNRRLPPLCLPSLLCAPLPAEVSCQLHYHAIVTPSPPSSMQGHVIGDYLRYAYPLYYALHYLPRYHFNSTIVTPSRALVHAEARNRRLPPLCLPSLLCA